MNECRRARPIVKMSKPSTTAQCSAQPGSVAVHLHPSQHLSLHHQDGRRRTPTPLPSSHDGAGGSARPEHSIRLHTHTPPAAFTSCYYYTTRRTTYMHLSIPSFVLCNACASRAFLHPVPLINSRALGSLLASRMPRSKPWRAAGTAAASCSSRCARHAVDAK
jgi:hypothetical protein